MIRRLLLLALSALLPAALAIAALRIAADRDARVPRVHEPPPTETGHELATRIDGWLGQLIDPGSLSNAHAALAGASRCLDCHGAARSALDARCVDCHAEIGERQRLSLAWHGRFTQPCAQCHGEHRGSAGALIELDRAAFQHGLTRFPLRGAHAEASCDACHRALPRTPASGETAVFRFQGIPSASCTGCHADPHAGGTRSSASLGSIRQVALTDAASRAPDPAPRSARFPLAGRDCARCHGEASFRAAQLRPQAFDHAEDAGFALRGAHASVACEGCHTPERRQHEIESALAPGQAARGDCAACHADPHRGSLQGREGCRSCHTESGWTHAFDHARDTRFRLDDLHSGLACASCHTDARFRAAGRTCESCHRDAADLLAGRSGPLQREPDAHAGGLRCSDCHGTTRAENHPAALARRCSACHSPEYSALLVTWTAKLAELAAKSPLDPMIAERLRRSGVHGFALARERLAGDSSAGAAATP